MYDVCNGTGAGGASATLVLTVGSGPAGSPQGAAINDLVVVCAGSNAGGSQVISSVTDSKANTYAQQVSDTSQTNRGGIWTSKITTALVAGTDTITVTWSTSAGSKEVVVKGATGVTSATADVTVHAGAVSTAPNSGPSGVLPQAKELIVAMIASASAGGQPGSLSTGGPGTTAHSSGGAYLTEFSQTVNSTASVTMSGVLPNSANWCCMLATFPLSASGALAVTSTSPPSGTVGTSYTYSMTASGGSGAGYKFNVRDGGPLPPGLQWSPGTLPGILTGRICGSTIINNSLAAIDSNQTAWKASIFPNALMKIYFSQIAQYPTQATQAAWKTNAHVGTAIDNNIPVILCYRPTVSGTTNPGNWPGGAIFPASSVLSSEYTSMKASIQSIQNVALLTVVGVIMWQECDNDHNYAPPATNTGQPMTSPFQATYLYFAHYAQFKADFPTVPLIYSLAGYKTTQPDRDQFFPGPTPTNPAGWGPGACYCDAVTTDVYCTGFDAMSANSRGRYPYAEPDRFSPGPPATGLPGYADIADFNNIAYGNIENGNSVGLPPTGNPTPLSTVQNCMVGLTPNSGSGKTDTVPHSFLYTFQKRLDASLPNIGYAWYEDFTASGFNHIDTPATDSRTPWLIQLDAALSRIPQASAKFAGTPTTNGSYPLTVQVTDDAGSTATAAMTIVIGTGTTALQVDTSSLQGTTNGQAYSVQLAAHGGTGTGFTWTINTGSLTGSGISLSSGGLLSGTATNSGSSEVDYTVQFKVTDSGSNTALSGTLTLAVLPSGTATPPTITNVSPFPAGTTSLPYVATFTFANGTPPYTVALTGDSPPLPPGLMIVNTDPADDESGADITDEFGVNVTSEA